MADLHFHDLRHEAISRLVEAGLSDQQAAAISGHKSMQMLKRYTHLRAVDLVEVLDTHLARRSARMRMVSSHALGTDWQNPRWSWLCLQSTHAKPASTVPAALPGRSRTTQPTPCYGCYSVEISGDWPPTTGGGKPCNA
jgi:hypothetical protein